MRLGGRQRRMRALGGGPKGSEGKTVGGKTVARALAGWQSVLRPMSRRINSSLAGKRLAFEGDVAREGPRPRHPTSLALTIDRQLSAALCAALWAAFGLRNRYTCFTKAALASVQRACTRLAVCSLENA